MPRWVRVIVWVAVFTACAGIGAFIASKSNPFPPGVEDPGARPTGSSTSHPTPPPIEESYFIKGTARTHHDLFVGGSCATDWTLELHVAIYPGSQVKGSGAARLIGKLRCDFPTAQAQAKQIDVSVRGHLRGAILDLTITPPFLRIPDGSNDFGGLTQTLSRFPSISLSDGQGVARSSVRIDDGDQGAYVAVFNVRAVTESA